MNVRAQYLQTTKDIGYVVIDAEYSAQALEKLSAEEGTIRCRVLF